MFLYYVILCLALLTNFVTLRLRRLPIGRAWEALREDEIACRSLGINTRNTKLTAFALGAFFGGLAGSFFAVRQGFISPESFTFTEFGDDFGDRRARRHGLADRRRARGGVPDRRLRDCCANSILPSCGQRVDELIGVRRFPISIPRQYRGLLFGLAMVVMMVFRPRGFVSTRSPSIFLKERKAVSGSLVKEGHG